MIQRKYWAEGHCVENSAQKDWGETSNSFRMWFRGWLLMVIFGFFVPFDGINEMNHVTAKRELFGGSLKVLGADIFLLLCIGPLQRCGDELHQMVHDHPPTFLRIEKRVSEPGVDTPGPLSEIQLWKGWAINPLQSQENVTHFPLRMALNSTITLDPIQPSPELLPTH